MADKIKKPTELQEQIALMQWASKNSIIKKLLVAIPNGGYRLPREAAIMKRMGVKKGVSDLLLAYPNKGYHGLWIELKRDVKSAKLSEEQKEWLELMEEQGYLAKVAYGCDQAIAIIENYIKLEVKEKAQIPPPIRKYPEPLGRFGL